MVLNKLRGNHAKGKRGEGMKGRERACKEIGKKGDEKKKNKI